MGYNVTAIKQSISLGIVMMLLSGCVRSSLDHDPSSLHDLPEAYGDYTGSYTNFTLV
jgi:hypothetical protein